MTTPSNLGPFVREYKKSGKSFAKILTISLVCLAIALLLFVQAFSSEQWDQRIVLTILGLVISLPTVFGFYMLITRRGSSVALHQNGLKYRYGNKAFETTWDDIASLTETTACRIEGKDGRAFDLGMNVEGYEEIAEKLREETLNRLLPKAKEQIAGGSSVTFGGLKAQGKMPMGKALPDTLVGGGTFTVDRTGISLADDGTKISWSEVTNFGVRRGEGRRDRFAFFFIEDGTRSYQMNYGALPNAHLLLALCAEKAPHAGH